MDGKTKCLAVLNRSRRGRYRFVFQKRRFSAFFLVLSFVAQSLQVPNAEAAASSVIFTTQAEMAGVTNSGVDTTASPGDLTLSPFSYSADPPVSAKDVAVITSDPAAMGEDLRFILDAYFPNFTYDGSGTDDVFAPAAITSLGDLSGYDIVVTDLTTYSSAEALAQSVLDAFADAGGTVMESSLAYSVGRQGQTYPTESFDGVATSVAGMAYDGAYLWQLDNASPDLVRKIDPTDGSVVATYCAPNQTPRGIEYVSGLLYIADSWGNKLYAVSPSALPLQSVDGCATRVTGTVYNLSDLSPLSDQPQGLTWDGDSFWLVDSATFNLYDFTISGATLSQASVTDVRTKISPTPNTSTVRDLAFDGTTLWVADTANNTVYGLNPTTLTQTYARRGYDGWDGYLDSDPTAITVIDGDLWVADPDPSVNKVYNLYSFNQARTQFEYVNRTNDSVRTPGGEPHGLAYDGTYFWVADDYENKIYKMTTAGSVVSSCFSPTTRVKGLAYDGGSLYVAGRTDNLIYVLSAGDCSVTASYAIPGAYPEGLYHDGTSLWHADSLTDTIYRLNPATGAVLSSFASPGTDPSGLTMKDGNLWVADDADDKYYEINASTGAVLHTMGLTDQQVEGLAFVGDRLWSVDPRLDRVVDVHSGLIALGQTDAPSTNPGGFAYDGTYVWATDLDTDRIYKLNWPAATVVTSFAAPAANPYDIAWDGTYLWTVTGDKRVYKLDPGDGSVVSSFDGPSTSGLEDPRGVTYGGGKLYVSDIGDNRIYEVTTGGSVVTSYLGPGTAPALLAYDGSRVWVYDSDDKQFSELEFDGYANDIEGMVVQGLEGTTSRIAGFEFIDGDLWSVDSYFDMFFNRTTTSEPPQAVIQAENVYTEPYQVDDYFYFSARDTDDGIYLHRRLLNVPETGSRQVLAESSRGGAVYVHETRSNGGHVFVMDLALLGKNYEISRQSVPADTLFLNALGLRTATNGVHENERPTYASLLADLDTLVAANPSIVAKSVAGTASNGDPIYQYTLGTVGKPLVLMISGMHGNEQHSFIPTVRFLQRLVSQRAAGVDYVTNLLNDYEVKFIPLLNVYGIKNRSRYNANTVDINRNFDYQWGAFTGSNKGSAAFSETESRLVRDVILAASEVAWVNDAHSARTIGPGLIYGYDYVVTAPNAIQDVYDYFTTWAGKRWFEEKGGVGRWLTYDRYRAQAETAPYMTNWAGALGIKALNNEVMGKLDIGTERMIHTSSWYIAHYDAVVRSLAAVKGRAVYLADTGMEGSTFSGMAVETGSKPAGTDITYRYGSSATASVPSTWHALPADAPANRYLFVETTLSRASFSLASPTLSSLTIGYQASFGSTTANRVTLGRVAAGATNVPVTVSFELSQAASTPLTVTFPSGFSLVSAFTSGSCIGGSVSDFSYDSDSRTLTASKNGCRAGAMSVTGAVVNNPATPGAYTVSWVNDDDGSATVYILGSDQINVSAVVDPYVAFEVGTGSSCSGGFTATDWTVNLGHLGASRQVASSGDASVSLICTVLSTNATTGAVVTVKNANGTDGLKSASQPLDHIPSAVAAVSVGVPNYGLCYSTVSGDSDYDTGVTPAAAPPDASYGTYDVAVCTSSVVSGAESVAALSGSPLEVWRVSDVTSRAFAALRVKVAISATQPAHNDYSDSLTFVATATF